MPRLSKERFQELRVAILADKKSMSKLAKEFGVSETNVRQVRRKLLKVSAPLVAKQRAESSAQVSKVATDTIAERQRLRGELQKLIGQLDPMGPIAIPTKATIIEKVGRLLDSEDRAITMGRNLLSLDEDEVRIQTLALLDRIKAKVSPGTRDELVKAIAEERLLEVEC